MIATTNRTVAGRPVVARTAAAGVFRHEVAARRGSWTGDVAEVFDAARRTAQDRRRPVAMPASPAVVPADLPPVLTRSPEDMVEEYERWDGMA